MNRIKNRFIVKNTMTMKIHLEGRRLLLLLALALAVINALVARFAYEGLTFSLLVSGLLFGFVLQFFRHPKRQIKRPDEQLIYAPADGRVVVIEEVEDPEYFPDKRLQLSIFMSVTDVHVNRVPVSGEVTYHRYHPGRYLVAWHPKSSTENERSTTVIRAADGSEVLLRQIAGALARRIRTYIQAGQMVRQGEELGFIRFGSRMDILLPLDAHIRVQRGQHVKSNKTVLARLPAVSRLTGRQVKMEMEEGGRDGIAR